MIRVKQLHLENVGPFASQDFDFSINSGDPDIHIFTGINGTGKTTILHAIAAMFDHFENVALHKEYAANSFVKRFRYFENLSGWSFKSHAVGTFASIDAKADGFQTLCFGCHICRNVHKSHSKKAIGEAESKHVLHRSIDQYDASLSMNTQLHNPISFAAFGYSGHRHIESSPIRIGNESDFNPLKEALSFNGKLDSSSNVSNWIASRSASAAVEEMNGNPIGSKRTKEAVDTLIRSIESLTDNEYKFSIQTNPWKVAIRYFDQEVEFDVLPDGLRSILSWMGDLLMRLDNIPWVDKTLPVNEQHIILLLDEIEVHLHPKWQYQILPLTRKIFPNAQIFLTTHSPFILNSIDNAKIYRLKTDHGQASLENVVLSETGNSYSYVLENILETHNIFGFETMEKLKRFNELDKEIAKSDFSNEKEFRKLISELYDDGEEVMDMISSKLARLKRITGKDYFHGANQEKAAV